VKFDEANRSFTLYPQRGNFRGLYSCFQSNNFDRAANADELHSVTYYYSFERIGGKEYMVIRFSLIHQKPAVTSKQHHGNFWEKILEPVE